MRRGQRKSLGSSFLDARSEYAAMRDTRFRRVRPGVTSMPGGADTRYASEARFIRMREYARSMVDDDFAMKFLVNRAVTVTVGTGFGYEPDTGDAALDRDLKDRQQDWAGDRRQCDVAGTLTFPDIEQLTVFNELVDGDVYHVGTDEGAIQTYESHRLATPTKSTRNIVHGVLLTEKRQRVSYFFRKEPPGTQPKYDLVRDFHEVPAWDDGGNPVVFPVFDPYRFTQTRGVTAFHPVFDKAGMLEDVDFSLLVKQQASAMLAWEWQTDPKSPGGPPPGLGAESYETQSDGSTMAVQEISTGSVVNSPPGKKLVLHASQMPSPEAMAHLRHCMQMLSLNLGLPLCIALMEGKDENFSGQRFAMDLAKLGWRRNQARYERMLHRPVMDFLVRFWTAAGDAFGRAVKRAAERKSRRRRVNPYRHWWQKPGWPYPQPLHDAQAWAVRVQTGQSSLRDMHGENGGDFRQFVRDNVRDRMLWIGRAIRATERLKKKYGEAAKDVHWTHLYHCDMFKGVQVIDTMEQANDGSGQQPAPAGGGGK